MAANIQEFEGLLAFYVNGTLSPEERAVVEDRLDKDPDLRASLDETRELYADMHQEPLPHRVDTGFARLMKAIESTPQDPVPAPADAQVANQTSASPILKFALVASLVALVVQGTLFWRGGGEFGLASGATQGALTVAFQPEATEGDIRALLMELDLQIISGPSSLGLYQIKGDGSDTVLEALAARTDIVESAENAME